MTDCPIDPSTGNPFPGNMVPIDQNTAPFLEGMIPLPTGGVPGAATWQASPSLPTNWREELIRVDHNFSPKVRGMFRYIHDSWSTIYPNPLWTSGTSFPTIETNFNGPSVGTVARLTVTFSPTLLNEFVASYTTDHINLNLVGNWKRQFTTDWGLFPNNGGKLPGVNLAGGIYGGIAEDPAWIPNGPLNSNPTYTYRDNVTKIIGKHNLQFGGYFVAAQKNEIPQPAVSTNGFLTFDTSDSGITTGNAFADVLMGNIAEFDQQKSVIKTYNRYKIFEPYFQDDFHATRRLTLNLGLRISMFGTQRERYHNAWNWDPAHYVAGASNLNPDGTLVSGANQFNGWLQCGVGSIPPGCDRGHLFNPAPRIGFAYDPQGNGKWAIRGGYGIFWEHMNANEAGTGALEPQNPLTLTTSIFNIAGPNGYETIVPQPAGTATPLSVVSIPNKATWPYVQQWHFDVQHEIVRNTVATVAYVGSKGTHLAREFDLNQVRPTPLSQNPYQIHEPLGVTTNPATQLPNECGTTTDQFGVPIDGTTSLSNTPIPYNGPGVLSPAVNAGIAICGVNANLFRPFVGVGGIIRKEESSSSTYHALQTSLRRSVGGLLLSLAYTYSHSIDDASSGIDLGLVNTYDLRAARASSNFDQRHLFSLSYVYDLPFFKSPGLANKLLGGWQWSGITAIQTGSPFSVSSAFPATDNAGVGNTLSDVVGYPDLIGDPRSGVSQANAAVDSSALGLGPLLFNPAAFVAPRGLTFGNAGRNVLNNPRRTNFDMALFKHFKVKEQVAFEFRAEAFNIFNHTEWAWLGGDAGSAASNSAFSSPTNSTGCYGGPNNSAGDPSCTGSASFLHAAAAHNPRILQLGLKFIF